LFYRFDFIRMFRLIAVLTLSSLTCFTSCNRGPAPVKRGKLEGSVTVNGKPPASGVVRFMTLEPGGLNVIAPIHDGRFAVSEKEGPTKGKYRVEVSVPSATKRRIPSDDSPGQFIEEAPETLPPRYNSASTLVEAYDPGTPKSYDFKMTTP
jgi:hypothetical protein